MERVSIVRSGGRRSGPETLNITDYYSDGVRVVQEVGWKGVNAREVVEGSSTFFLPRRANEMGLPGTQQTSTCGPNPPSGDWLWADRRLQREYVWAADPGGYVDECVAQVVYTAAHDPAPGSVTGEPEHRGDDTTPTVLYTLSDHNANVIALANDGGDLVAQYGYTPYGELRNVELFATPQNSASSSTSAENLLAARGNRLGHQGLRTERYDRSWDDPMPENPLSVGAVGSATEPTGPYRAVCHNRNRIYDPAEGRFTSRDPNGLAMPILDSMAYGGMPVMASDISPNVTSHYGDGMNAHGTYKSSPRYRQDPLGLYDPSDGYDGDEFVEDVTDLIGLFDPIPGPGDYIREVLRALTSDYSENLSFDVDWASDWSLPDEDHSRMDDLWVMAAIGRGLHAAFDIDLPFTDETANPFGSYASSNAIASGKKSGGSRSPGAGGTGSVHTGNTIHTRRGQSAHTSYEAACSRLGIRRPQWEFEKTIPGVGRVDAIDLKNYRLRELKPNTPSGRARGVSQVTRYIAALEKKFPQSKGKWTAIGMSDLWLFGGGRLTRCV